MKTKKGLKAELTLEAAVIFSLLLLLLAGVMTGSVRLWQRIRSEAEKVWAAEETREREEISPVDLIEIGELLKEWVPRPEKETRKGGN